MLSEVFSGKRLRQFQVDPIIKAYIVSETLLWSAWNFIAPIFAIFATALPGGSIEIAASCYSTHLISRVIFEIITGRYVARATEYKKFIMTITGMMILTLSYILLSLTHTIPLLYFSCIISGMAIGIATPAKNTLFSSHLDKNKESEEWSILDTGVLTGVALAATLGGFIASKYGFSFLYIIAAIINTIGIIPYFLYLHIHRRKRIIQTIRNIN